MVIGAFSEHSEAAFNRWVGWATIAAVPIAAAGLLPVLWDKVTEQAGRLEGWPAATEDELHEVGALAGAGGQVPAGRRGSVR
jgi:hypothetical protein